MKITPKRLKWGMNVWPPFVGAGVRVRHIADDWTAAVVEYRLNPLTKNYVGVAFGGTLSSMTDAYFMLLTMNQLGGDYVVWDTAAEIDFVAPGRSHLTARMEVPAATVEKIREQTADGSKSLTWFETTIRDADDQLVARVRRQVYARRKQRVGATTPTAQG